MHSTKRRVGWYIAWRSLLFGGLSAIVLGFASGFLLSAIGAIIGIRETTHAIIPWVGGSLGLLAQIWMFFLVSRSAIGRRFGDYELQLVPVGS